MRMKSLERRGWGTPCAAHAACASGTSTEQPGPELALLAFLARTIALEMALLVVASCTAAAAVQPTRPWRPARRWAALASHSRCHGSARLLRQRSFPVQRLVASGLAAVPRCSCASRTSVVVAAAAAAGSPQAFEAAMQDVLAEAEQQIRLVSCVVVRHRLGKLRIVLAEIIPTTSLFSCSLAG